MPSAAIDLTAQLSVLASTLAVLMVISTLLEVLPMCLSCYASWKECVHLHDASGRMRKCSITASILMIPFVCTAAGFRLHPLATHLGDTQAMILLTSAIIAVSFFLLHRTMALLCRIFTGADSSGRKALTIAMSADHPFFMVCSTVMTITAAISLLLPVNQDIIKTTLLWELGLSYAVCFIRKFQIFASYRSFFAAFLYLCALEILPCGALILAAIL